MPVLQKLNKKEEKKIFFFNKIFRKITNNMETRQIQTNRQTDIKH